MVSKFGLYPGGSWIFHSACQFCEAGERVRKQSSFEERESANVQTWVSDVEDKGPFVPQEEWMTLYLQIARFERIESFLLTHVHGCGPVLADYGSRPIGQCICCAGELGTVGFWGMYADVLRLANFAIGEKNQSLNNDQFK